MKATFFAILSTCALWSNISFAQTSDKLKAGDKLPAADVAMLSTDGKKVTLKRAMGENGLLVMFSCNTCPFVIKNQSVTKMTMDYAVSHKVGMVIINSNEAQRGDADSYAAMQKYAGAQGYRVPYVMDEQSKVADIFGANHTPEIFLFDNKGTLQYKGAMNDNPSDPGGAKKMYANQAIDALVAGRKMDPNETRSIGCSIKRKA